MGMLLFLVAGLITYGSLYPFEFSQAGVDQAAIDAFLASWTAPSSRGDILGNIVLFIPFGLLGMLALPPRDSRIARFLLLLVLGFVLAAGVQVIQLYVPTRSPALVDVIWNMVGLMIGALPAIPARVQAMVAGQRLISAATLPFLLVGCWIGSLLVPFVPSIDFQLWKDSVKPLLFDPAFEIDAFVRDFPAWLAAACLGALVVGERWLPVKFTLVVLATLGLKIVIVKNDLDFTDVAAAAAAILTFGVLIRYLPRRELVVAALLLAGHVYLGLSPFEARVGAPEFAWIPFQGALSGSMFINASVIAYKVFFYGALVWQLLRGGLGYLLSAIIAILAAGVVEFGQLHMGHGTPEITDPILAILAAVIIAALTPMDGRRTTEVSQPLQPVEQANPVYNTQAAATNGNGWLAAPLRLVIAVGLIVGGMFTLQWLPGIPYNVQELLSISAPRTVILALAFVWLGMGPALAGSITARSRWQPLVLPVLCIASGIISFYLIDESVSDESLFDIIGVPTIYRDITKHGLWGENGEFLVGIISSEWAFVQLEAMVRYVALYSLLALPLAALTAAFCRLDEYQAVAGARRILLFGLAAAVYLIMAAPLLVLCKYVVFDFANTDNIVELIAPLFGYRFGGAWVLILLFVLLATNATFLSWRQQRWSIGQTTIKWVVILASLPIGWFLANLAFEDSIEKYGLTFKALDFLLGANREASLTNQELIIRWFIAQGGMVLVIAFGAAILPGRHYQMAAPTLRNESEAAI